LGLLDRKQGSTFILFLAKDYSLAKDTTENTHIFIYLEKPEIIEPYYSVISIAAQHNYHDRLGLAYWHSGWLSGDMQGQSPGF
jgi:hypothetical protein